MRIVTLGLIAFFAITSLTFAQSLYAAGTETLTLNGTLIDNACASGHMNDLGGFIKTHTKECTLAPACAASGYSIYSQDKLYKFDDASSKRIEEFLKGADNKLEVTVMAKQSGDKLELVTIENQK